MAKQLFALDIGLAAVYVCAMAFHVFIHISVRIDLLRNLLDEERVRKAESVLRTSARLGKVCVLGFIGTALIAVLWFPERLAELLQERSWILFVVALVFVSAPLFDALVVRAAEKRLARWKEGQNT